MKTYIKLIVVCILAVFLTACKKDKNEPAPQAVSKPLILRLTPKAGNDTLKFNAPLSTENNERYTISSFRYYMSDISLIKKDGSEHKMNDKVFLVTPNTSDYVLDAVPVGEYTGIRFSVGLNNVTNHLDPTRYPVAHPLAIQSPAMHWSWNTGYIFLMLEGSCDTTATNTDVLTYGQYSHGLFYHIGMDPMLRVVTVDNSTFAVSGNNNVVHIHSDLNKLFTGVNMKTEYASHTMGSMPLATKIADNIPAMFTVEQ